jgi:hypothetical protein
LKQAISDSKAQEELHKLELIPLQDELADAIFQKEAAENDYKQVRVHLHLDQCSSPRNRS